MDDCLTRQPESSAVSVDRSSWARATGWAMVSGAQR